MVHSVQVLEVKKLINISLLKIPLYLVESTDPLKTLREENKMAPPQKNCVYWILI